MDNLITIRTENGTLIINLEHFFPTTQTRCKKLIKAVLTDYKNYKALLQQICVYLELEITKLDEKRIYLSSKWYEYHQKKADAKEIFFKANENMSRALYLELNISKEEKQRVKGFKKEWKSCERIFNQTERDLNKSYTLQENLRESILPLFQKELEPSST